VLLLSGENGFPPALILEYPAGVSPKHWCLAAPVAKALWWLARELCARPPGRIDLDNNWGSM